jgi:hypothetical protein
VSDTPGQDWERRVDEAWAAADDYTDGELVERIDELAAELPEGSPVAAFERAGSFDSTGRPELAVPLYREALGLGLDGISRRRAVIQLAALLTAERDRGSDELDDAVSAFLALALVDTGREREAVSVALSALAPHLPRYQRSLANYARLVND